VATERDALSRAQIFAEALQSRINVLSADFVNRDDPAQRDVVAAERQKALAELDRVKQEIQQHQKAMTTIQDEARRAGVPAGWTR
jgi:ATP-dependent exoDNAse (exonuclease V) alpha subunit